MLFISANVDPSQANHFHACARAHAHVVATLTLLLTLDPGEEDCPRLKPEPRLRFTGSRSSAGVGPYYWWKDG